MVDNTQQSKSASTLSETIGLVKDLSPSRLRKAGIPHTRLLELPKRLLLASTIINLLRIARGYLVGLAAARFSHNTAVEAVDRILNAPTGLADQDASTKNLERIDAVAKVGDFYGGQSRLLMIDLPFAFLFIAMIGMIGGVLVLIPFALIALFGLSTIRRARELRQVFERREEEEAKKFDFVEEVLSGITTVKGHAMEPPMLRRFERLAETAARLNLQSIRSAGEAQMVATMLGNVATIAMVTAGGMVAIYSEMSIGALAACTMLTGRAVQPILRAAGTWHELQKTRVAIKEASALFELPPVATAEPVRGVAEPPEIILEDVAHRPARGGHLWQGINLHIEPGETIGVAGRDGSGKSTLLRVIAGLAIPERGLIKIDGQSADLYRGASGSVMGCVTHQTAPFRGSILDNLTIFGHGATIEEARWAAQLVGVEDDIHRLPDGYDTRLGEGISEILAGGLIRRILITRAIAQKPALLILDEPEAFLDQVADEHLLDCLTSLRGTMTTVMVTNRPSYLALADRVYELSAAGLIDKRSQGREDAGAVRESA